MERLVSSDFYNILNQISDQNLNYEHIFSVFRKELPGIAKKNGIVLLKAEIYEPIKRSSDMSVSEIEIYDVIGEKPFNKIQFEYTVVNGGKVVVTSGIREDAIWTDELKEDVCVLARIIYLMAGRLKTMATLSEIMFFDQLTGIPNETSLMKFMSKTLAQGIFAEYCSNFLNIKNMKLVNSRYGDKTGDSVMLGFAKAIDDFAKSQGNGIAARLGGDNFLVFIEKKHQEEFKEFINNITVPYTKQNGDIIDIKVEARLGYYYIKAGEGINEAMRNADVAAKLAKSSTYPDCVEFEESMKIQLLKMKQLEQNIPEALEKREFVVFYQPKVDISQEGNYVLNGAEALVRWVKDGEMIPPGEFIPVLEKNGLVSLVDYYVFEQVCRDINQWIDRGMKPVKISSNFSRRHLLDSQFADKVEAVIKKYNIDPQYLEIEITESYDEEDMQALTNFEKRMHALGVDLAVDDFGSGFSSIMMIKNIVADTIKLDKSLIDGIGNDGADDIIISHIIQMINCLGKNIIAEGVETEKQASFLRKNECKNIQGYLFSKPCPKEEFEKFLNA